MIEFDLLRTLQITFSLLLNQNFIIKILLLVFATLYLLYTIIFSRQIFILNHIIHQVTFSPVLKTLAMVNIFLSIGILLIIFFAL